MLKRDVQSQLAYFGLLDMVDISIYPEEMNFDDACDLIAQLKDSYIESKNTSYAFEVNANITDAIHYLNLIE